MTRIPSGTVFLNVQKTLSWTVYLWLQPMSIVGCAFRTVSDAAVVCEAHPTG
jgi:hypothetical protein